jgi:hypothetical protein
MENSHGIQILGILFMLAIIVASIVVRFVTAVFSKRIRNSIVLHPVAHLCWVLGSLLAASVLVLFLWPHIANRLAHGA